MVDNYFPCAKCELEHISINRRSNNNFTCTKKRFTIMINIVANLTNQIEANQKEVRLRI